jgi:hypothetical protein
MVEIGRIEVCHCSQTINVVKRYTAIPKRGQTALPQIPQDAIDVHRTQSKGIRKMILSQWTGIASLTAQSDQSQLGTKLEQEVRYPCFCVTLPEPDEMFDHHRFIAGRRPEDSSC